MAPINQGKTARDYLASNHIMPVVKPDRLLEGSVRRAGNTVRITAQLINSVTGFHLWSDTYDRPFSDILKVQTEVATAVAQQLEIKLAGNATQFAVGGTRNRAYP